MAFVDLLNVKANIYKKTNTGGNYETWVLAASNILTRIRTIKSTDAIAEAETYSFMPTNIAYFQFTDGEHLKDQNALKITAVRDRISRAWVDVANGDEYIIVGRPDDAAGEHHHYVVRLSYLQPGALGL